MDLSCEFATIDVYDVLGTNTQVSFSRSYKCLNILTPTNKQTNALIYFTPQNISKNVEKWQLDETGVKRIFSGRNKMQSDIKHDEHHPDIETLHANGVHAIPINEETFDDFLKVKN